MPPLPVPRDFAVSRKADQRIVEFLRVLQAELSVSRQVDVILVGQGNVFCFRLLQSKVPIVHDALIGFSCENLYSVFRGSFTDLRSRSRCGDIDLTLHRLISQRIQAQRQEWRVLIRHYGERVQTHLRASKTSRNSLWVK